MARLCLAALSLSIPSCAGEALDAEALVQTHVEQQTELLGGLARSRLGLLAQAEDPKSKAKFNCSMYPAWCQAPFNCQTALIPQMPTAMKEHANLQSWCGAPQYYNYMTACVVDRDLKRAAQVQYQWSVDQHSGVEELDGSYCFMEGHCTNIAVTANTTVEEGEKMCDRRYGHNGWAHWSPTSEHRAIFNYQVFGKTLASPVTGFRDPKITRVFLKMACAMGNYHCDVMYCKETYCKQDYYIKKYKHLEPKTPGHLLDQHLPPL